MLLVSTVFWSCSDRTGITGTGDVTGVALQPSFQLLPAPIGFGLVDRIRIRALDAGTGAVVASTEVVVDPLAEQWALELAVDLGSALRMDLVVETELLAGDSVEWSGRTEPFSAESGPTVPQPVDVFRGPLDNLDAVDLSIESANPRLTVGSQLDLAAVLTLDEGSEAEPVVYWGSSNALVAGVGSKGNATTVTGLLPGTSTIYAGAGRVTDSVTVEVGLPASQVVVSATSALLAGLGLTTRLSAEVLDSAGTPVSDATVAWSTADGTVLSVDQTGLVTSLGFGGGTITATADGNVSGTLDLSVLGPDLVPTALDVVPNLLGGISLLSATQFSLGIENVGGAASDSATLELRFLDGATGDPAYTALSVPLGAIDPGESVSIDLADPGIPVLALPPSLRFEVVVDRGGGVAETDESNNVLASGLFDVVPLAPLGFDVEWLGLTADWNDPSNWSTGLVPTATDAVFVPVTTIAPTLASLATVGDLGLDSGAVVDLATETLEVTGGVVGDLAAIGTGTLRLLGDHAALRGSASGSLELAGNVALAGDLSAGDLLVDGDGASLDPGDHVVSVAGDFATANGGTLVMSAPSAVLEVLGDAAFLGGPTSGLLTDGLLDLRGDLTVSGLPANALVTSAGHRTELRGSVQNLTTSGGSIPPTFAQLVVADGVSATLGTDVVVQQLTTGVGSTLDQGGREVTVSGDLSVLGGLSNGLTTALGGGTLRGDFDALAVSGDVSLSGPVGAANVALEAGTLDLAGGALTVAGDLHISGPTARLRMTDPGDLVAVGGDVTFDGASHDGLLSAGTLSIAGNLTVTASSPAGFVGTGTHAVVLDGVVGQTVSLAAPGAVGQRFANLTTANTSATGVVLGSDVVVTGAVTVGSGSLLAAADDVLSVGGSLTSSGTIQIGELSVIGNLTQLSSPLPGDLTIAADFALPANLDVGGDVTVTGGALDVGGNALSVGGNLLVQGGSARLVMLDPSSVVDVAGAATFDGATHDGALTAGLLSVAGDFTATAASVTSFAASGTHETVLDGTGTQAVSLAAPGDTLQRFNDLTVASPGGVDLATTATVMGTFAADGVELARAGAGAVVDARGLVALDQVTLTSLPLRITSAATPSSHVMNQVTWTSMDPADVQLYLEMPGFPADPANFTSLTFDSPAFTTGAHVQTERLSGLGDVAVVLTGTSPILLLSVVIQGTGTLLTWL